MQPSNELKSTQRRCILKHLEQHSTIDNATARECYGIERLSARISELRHDFGYDIRTKKVLTINRLGIKTHYASYSLVNELKEVVK